MSIRLRTIVYRVSPHINTSSMSSRKVERITEWWRPKAGTIFSLLLFYLAVWKVPYADAWRLLLFSGVTLIGFGITAYFLNDWADIPFDRKVGKTNLVSDLSIPVRLGTLLVLLCVTLLPWVIYFESDTFSIVLIILQLALMVAYPVPPFRLKNIPKVAMFADALYAFAIPAVLAWHTFDLTTEGSAGRSGMLLFLFLAVWMLSVGLRQITAHHVLDMENDRRSATPNLAISVPPMRLRLIVQKFIVPVEFSSSLLFFISLLAHGGWLPLFPFVVIIILGSSMLLDSGFGFYATFGRSALDGFSSFWLGVFSGAVLLINDGWHIIVLIAFLALFSKLTGHPIVPVILKQTIFAWRMFLSYPFRMGSLWFNWSLYYFRKWFLKWSEERNWGVHYEKHLTDLSLQARKERGIVAVFNQNRDKYTETFVRGHLGNLPYHTIPFYGWPSMVHTGDMENLIAGNEFVLKAKYSWWHLIDASARNEENKVIAERLIKENVELILAEFGTVGARMVDVSKLTGIPLVVIFYGYDAWHSRTIQENHGAYQELFRHASAVIGVSKDICTQLQELGCNPQKIAYLPCYVNLDLFRSTERDFSGKVLLAVGRFCVTKAPHLTILAFHNVLEQHPDAQLRMVGADDGGGILEMCRSLVASLGIGQHVKFLGCLTPERVEEEMRRASIFVQHSVTAPETGDKEGTPVAIMEAMACGLPVVSTRHAGIAEVIDDGISGILVDEFDHQRMAQEISGLLSDPDRLERMGAAAAAAMRNNPKVSGHLSLLTEIIDRHRVPT